MPVDILRWAEDYAKLINAPDDVSYEAANGAVEAEEAKATDGTSESEKNEDVPGSDNESSDGDSTEVEATNEVSLYDQAGILIQESGTARKDVSRASKDSSIKAAQGTKVAQSAEDEAKNTEAIAKTRKAEYDKLLREIESDKANITPEKLMKLDQLANQLTAIGNKAQSQLTIYDAQLQEIEAEFAIYDKVPPLAEEKGSESVDVGSQLVTNNTARQADIQNRAKSYKARKVGKFVLEPSLVNVNLLLMTSKTYRRGVHAISAGTKAITASNEAKDIIAKGHETNQNSTSQIAEAMDQVKDLTLVEGNRFSANEEENSTQEQSNTQKAPENKNQTKAQKEKSSTASTANKTDDNGVKDSTILTDALEIQRRKANRGEYPPTEQA